MENIFINATRKKYRFNYKGVITTEDLWDLSLPDLDSIYKSLRNKLKQEESEESLLSAKTPANNELAEKIEIIKHIVSVKKAEADSRRAEVENAQRRQQILDVINRKKVEALDNMSIEDLQKMLDD